MNECYYYTASGPRYQNVVTSFYNHKLINKHSDVWRSRLITDRKRRGRSGARAVRYVNADNYVTNDVLTFNKDTFSADIKWINELEPFVVLRNDRCLSEINARIMARDTFQFTFRFIHDSR